MIEIIQPVLAHEEETGFHHHMMGGGDFGFFSSFITMALIWIALVLVIIALVVYVLKYSKK